MGDTTEEMTKGKVTLERVCEAIKYGGRDNGLAQFDMTDLEQLARELESHQQFPYVVAAIHKETHARRWLLNRDENKDKERP